MARRKIPPSDYCFEKKKFPNEKSQIRRGKIIGNLVLLCHLRVRSMAPKLLAPMGRLLQNGLTSPTQIFPRNALGILAFWCLVLVDEHREDEIVHRRRDQNIGLPICSILEKKQACKNMSSQVTTSAKMFGKFWLKNLGGAYLWKEKKKRPPMAI